MKKIIKTIFVLVMLVTIIAIVYMVGLYPVHKYRENTAADKSFDVNAMLKKSIPKNFSLENGKIKITINLTEDEIRNLILSEINKNGNVDGVEISIVNNKINIYVIQKVWTYFPTEMCLLSAEILISNEINDQSYSELNIEQLSSIFCVPSKLIKYKFDL